VPFDIERTGPTRIYPVADYEIIIKVKANQDFKGSVVETVPMTFKTWATDGTNPERKAVAETYTKTITWQVDWEKGNTYELKYKFDAPDVSPYLYLLGPLKIGDFSEIRKWQVAADAIVFDAISSNWAERVTSLDLTHVIGTANIIVVTVQIIDATLGERTISSVVLDPTGTPEGFTHAAADRDDGIDIRTEIWYLMNPVKTGSSTIRITAGGSCTDLAGGAISLGGADTDNLDAIQTGSGSNSPPSISITTTAGAYAIDSFVSNDKDPNFGSVHNEIHLLDVGGDNIGSQYVDAGDAGPQTMNYTSFRQLLARKSNNSLS